MKDDLAFQHMTGLSLSPISPDDEVHEWAEERANQRSFDYAEQRANESVVARFMARLWYVPFLPPAIRKAGMAFWNRRYRSFLPDHLVGTRYTKTGVRHTARRPRP